MVRSFRMKRTAGAGAGVVGIIRHAAAWVAVILACLLASASISSAADNVIKSSYESFAKFLRSIGNSEALGQIVRLRNDGRPFALHISPSDRSAITARLEPPTRYVEIVKGCIGEWCHVHLGLAAGWIRRDRLRLPEAREVRNEDPQVRTANRETLDVQQEVTGAIQEVREGSAETRNEEIADVQQIKVASVNAVNIPLPIRKAPLQVKIQEVSAPPLPAPVPPLPAEPTIKAESLIQAEPVTRAEPVIQAEPVTRAELVTLDVKTLPFRQTTQRNIAALQPSSVVNTSLKVSEVPKKLYSLTDVEGITFLPVREDRSDNAAILGGIPFFANNVEALGLCVDEWCLVRYGEDTRGWIRQRHLSDTHRENTPLLQLQNTNDQTAVALYDEPDKQGKVASFIDSKAAGIVPTGTCDLDWCHVLYEGKIGWIRSTYLARQ
jgi:SH3-like domain-containing protein